MKKVIKWGLIIFVGFVVLSFLLGGGKDEKDSPKEDSGGRQKAETEVTEKVTQTAILSGEDPETGEVISEINVWQKPGSGGPDNVAVGNVPHDTKVEVLESKEAEGRTFYYIRSSVGKVSVLPTEWEARERAMRERPKGKWFVDADETFPVKGWVVDSFITDLK